MKALGPDVNVVEVDTETSGSNIDVGAAKGTPARTDDEAPVDEYAAGLRHFLLILAIALSIFLGALDQTILGTAIPKITDQFNRLDDIAWYGAAYFTCFGGFQPLWGKSYKYFPLKPVFVVVVAIFEAGSLLCGAAPNSPALIAGRAIAGVGGAGVACGASTIVGLCTPKEKRPIFLGIIGVTYAFAAVVGPLLGGAFSDRVSWRWCFYVNVPIGGVVALVILGILRLPALVKPIEAPLVSKLGQLDFVGVGLTMAAMVCFILALQYGGVTHPWSSSVVIGLLVGFAAIVVTLVLWEMHRGERAMLVPRLLSNRTLWAGAGFQFFFAGSYFLLLFFLPLYFQSVKAASPVRSGVLTLPFVVTAGLFIVGGGITVAKTGHAIPFTTAGAAIATVGFGLLYTLETGTPAAKWIGYQILLGAGIAFPFQNCLSTVQATVATADIASATSIMLFFQILGGAFSMAIATAVSFNRLIAALPTSAPTIDPKQVIHTGATELRAVFPQEEIVGILMAYMEGIKSAFAVAIGMAGIALVFSLINPWKRILINQKGEKEATSA